MKVRVTKLFTFESAHHLPSYPGKCRTPHGHSYKLEVTVEREGNFGPAEDWREAMTMDFGTLKHIVKEQIVDQLDHKDLNTVTLPGFPNHMTTAENMVAWMWELLVAQIDAAYLSEGVQLVAVRLWETATCYAEVVR